MPTQPTAIQPTPPPTHAAWDRAGRATGSWLVRYRRHAPGATGVGRAVGSDDTDMFGGTVGDDAAGAGANRLVVSGPAGSLTLRLVANAEPPSVASDGSVGAVLWGDVYFQDELRRVLGLARDAGRAAIAVAAYRRWGEALPTKLVGRFAIVLYDAHEDRLMAVRDRVGMVPLFRRALGRDGGMAGGDAAVGHDFALSADAFANAGDGKPALDLEVVAAFLARLRPDLPETFLDGVKRVPPGHVLVMEAGEERTTRHWFPPVVGEDTDWVKESDLPRFGELLDQAVARALQGEPAAIFLSGGLDSVSVAAAAAERCAREGTPAPLALSLLFPDDVSEEHLQRGVAEKLGFDLIAIPLEEALGSRGLLAAGLDLAARLPSPQQNVWSPAYDRLSGEGILRGARSILTGGGGDEWLTVSPLIAADYLRRGQVAALVRYIVALRRSLDIRTRHLTRNVLWTNGAKPLLRGALHDARERLVPGSKAARRRRDLEARVAELPRWIGPGAVRSALADRVLRRVPMASPSRPAERRSLYFREARANLDHPLFALDVEEIYETGRRVGAPQFDVYWDADLVEFLYRVPPHLLNRGGRSKGLVRDDLARRFPGFGFDRQKKLVSRNFFAETIFREGPAAWKELGGAEALAGHGLVDAAGVDAFVRDTFDVRDVRAIDQVWRLMSLEAWVRPRS
ncbi:MAG: asparagine synthase-related protein [Trueperaceae bacterium]